MSNQSTSLVSAKDKQQGLIEFFEKAKPSIAKILPKHLTPDRLLKIALGSIARTPTLLACTKESLLLAVVQAAELGLEAGGLLGECYLVPFKDKATMIPGYRGYVKLARQSGLISSLEAHAAHEKDDFLVELGLHSNITHKPDLTDEPGAFVAAYAVVHFKDGGHQFDVMGKAAINRIRDRSKAAADGPWITDYEEMAKKTVVRRLAKYLPLSPEIQKLQAHEDAVDANQASPLGEKFLDTIGEGEEPAALPPASRAESIKETLAANGATAPASHT